ncbi:hypothetical protein [Aliiroseovarius sp. 2305UL8-7]|uniref:hypothetical protein n=1 Tax=Aliiroseovarius conchicola TaxID=3121637 RepID=UPI00352781E9
MTIRLLGIIATAGILTACETGKPDAYSNRYVAPEASGLVALRPYPNPNDICQIIGENEETNDLLDHEHLLIGCPSHERGAIDDRVREGAEILKEVNGWTLLNLRIR